MTVAIDPATLIITIEQSDLTLISGNLYELDTDAFRKTVWDLQSAEAGIVQQPAFQHNAEVTVAGTTFARTLEFINGFSITFENLVYTVRLAGSNNNIFDVENGILNPSGNVTVIGQNSAGLITSQDSKLVKQLLANHSTIVVAGDGSRTITVLDSDDDTGNTVGVWAITADGLIRERTS